METITSCSSLCAHLAHALDWAEKYFPAAVGLGRAFKVEGTACAEARRREEGSWQQGRLKGAEAGGWES